MMYFTLLIYTNISLIQQHKKVERMAEKRCCSLTINQLLNEWLFSMDDQPPVIHTLMNGLFCQDHYRVLSQHVQRPHQSVHWPMPRYWPFIIDQRRLPLLRDRRRSWQVEESLNDEKKIHVISLGSSVRLFARTTHSFAHSALLALFACFAVLTCLLACSLHLLPCSWDSE